MYRDFVWRSGSHEELWVVCLELLGGRSVIAAARKVNEELSEGAVSEQRHVSAWDWSSLVFFICEVLDGHVCQLRFLPAHITDN